MKRTTKLVFAILVASILLGFLTASVLASQSDWYGTVGGVNRHNLSTLVKQKAKKCRV